MSLSENRKNHNYKKYSPGGQCVLLSLTVGVWIQHPLQHPGWGPTERAIGQWGLRVPGFSRTPVTPITSLPRRQHHVASLLVTAVLQRVHSGDQGFLGLQRFKKTETHSLEMRNEGHFTPLISQEHIMNNHPYLLKFSSFISPPHEIIGGHYIPCRSFQFRSFYFFFYFPSFKRTVVSTFSLVCAFL